MLQASMLHYPHLGVFQSPGLYPGLAAAGPGVRFPADYYSPGLSAMAMSSKFSEMGVAAGWLGMDG